MLDPLQVYCIENNLHKERYDDNNKKHYRKESVMDFNTMLKKEISRLYNVNINVSGNINIKFL